MEINIRDHTAHVNIIEIYGRLEAFTVGELRDRQTQLLDAGEKDFILDLRPTEFMDSAGLAALVSLLKHARQAGGKVILIMPSNPEASRILSLTRFDQVFQLADHVDAALEHFGYLSQPSSHES